MVVGPAATVGAMLGDGLDTAVFAVGSGVLETVESLDPQPAKASTAATAATHFTQRTVPG